MEHDHSDFNKEIDFQSKENPLLWFKDLYQDAILKNCTSPNVMVVSTSTLSHRISSRVVYLREILEEGLCFYTNYNSRKGKTLEENPLCSALFFWQELEIQVRVEGICEKLPSEMSDIYFSSRPRLNQLNAWASKQSESINSRNDLEKAMEYYDKKFPQIVPRPDFWGGFLIKPNYFEFWKGRLGRLHDRFSYELIDNNWQIQRLAP
ncbi:MAG: pyridoxamine 5'-phosphate oxidase [Flavobacteriia bacterium]|nr:pyridoxamine 5'-phosphate oxidase [Flavobacteriia bacterium]